MDRTQLRLLLGAGPSRRLNVLETTTRLQTEGRLDDLLFNTSFLNRSVLFKSVDTVKSGPPRRKPKKGKKTKSSRTLIFLPYDAERPGDGGEALPYDRENLRRVVDVRRAQSEGWVSSLEEDEATLDLLDELPTLNPFLLRDAFGRSGRAIPEPYLTLDPALTQRLRRRLEGRVRPLVIAALGGDGQEVGDHLERILEALLVPARGEDLRLLGRALQMEPETAPEVLSAWAGIAFFEEELDRLKPAIHTFAQWLAEEAEPREYLPPSQRRELDTTVRRLRSAVREPWREIRATLDQYRDTYISLVFEDTPAPFVKFLRHARSCYWRTAELFGAFEQAIYALELYQDQYGHGSLPARVLEEFLGFLQLTFKVTASHEPT